MAGSIDRIEQDIKAVEQAVQTIAQDFRTIYAEYLKALGQTVSQQLVLASYRLCTQGYPERFLQLSLQQRQRLQQSLRELGRQAQTQLIAPFQEQDQNQDQTVVLGEEPIATEVASEAPAFELDDPDNTSPDGAEIEQETAQNSDQAENLDSEELAIDFDRPLSPERLGRWQESLEQNTSSVMRSISHAANRLLQQAEVLPQKLPEPVLEVAAKAGMMTETASSTPNLLNLLVETDDEESKVTHIIAIRLRLAEIEFGDPILTNWRSKIRSLLARLNQLEREYQKKQRERAIAEAEAAWRSTWYED